MTQGQKNISTGLEISKFFESLGVQPELRSVLQVMVQALIEAEACQEIGAGKYERCGERKNLRNGYRRRKRPLQTGLGPLEVSIPKFRRGSFFPTILDRYQRVDRALIGVIQEAYIQGVSTRSMQRVFRSLGLTGLDKSTVSRLVQPVREAVERWRQRLLAALYPYVWLDALYVKLRQEGVVRSVVLLVAMGVREDGRREVLGFQLGSNESYLNWKVFFQHLKGRGLQRAGLWISDDHDGLRKAWQECFPGQLHQRCIVHWQRNALSKVSKGGQKWLTGLIQPLVNAPTSQAFAVAEKALLQEVQRKDQESLLTWLEESLPEVKTYLSFPECHYRQIKSTNPLERLNQEMRRRERVVRIFPSGSSCELLMGAILEDQSEEWVTGRRYLARELERVWKIVEKLTGIQADGTVGPGAATTATHRPAPLPPLRRAVGQGVPPTFTPQFGT